MNSYQGSVGQKGANTFLLESFRGDLMRFARLQLDDDHEAEDVVQETFAAAIDGAHKFSGRSALKTWVFAILRNKIADRLRQRYQTCSEQPVPVEHQVYTEGGRWNQDFKPSQWADPESIQNQQQFWRIFEACFTDLSPKQARVFMMREFIGLSI